MLTVRAATSLAVLGTLVLAAVPAWARDPRRVEVYAQPGFVRQWFVGDAGDVSTGSVGFQLAQGFHYGMLGFNLTLLTDYRLTRQDPPPYGSGLQTFSVAAGPRLHFALDPIEFVAGVDYASVGMVGNPLTELLGSAPRFHAFGGAASVRYFAARPIYDDAGVTARQLFGTTRPTTEVGMVFSLGLATTP